jgi:hypothetical protein
VRMDVVIQSPIMSLKRHATSSFDCENDIPSSGGNGNHSVEGGSYGGANSWGAYGGGNGRSLSFGGGGGKRFKSNNNNNSNSNNQMQSNNSSEFNKQQGGGNGNFFNGLAHNASNNNNSGESSSNDNSMYSNSNSNNKRQRGDESISASSSLQLPPVPPSASSSKNEVEKLRAEFTRYVAQLNEEHSKTKAETIRLSEENKILKKGMLIQHERFTSQVNAAGQENANLRNESTREIQALRSENTQAGEMIRRLGADLFALRSHMSQMNTGSHIFKNNFDGRPPDVY